MRRMMLLLMCATLALGGCRALIGSERSEGSSVDGAPGGVPGDDPIVGGGGGGGVDPPVQVFDNAFREEPDPTVVDFRGQAVDHFTIGADGRTVVVYWWGGNTSCFGLREVMVEVQRGTPIVTVLEGTRGDHVGQACTADAQLKSAVVVLDEPILADAADGQPAAGEPELPADAMQAKPMDGVENPIPHAIFGYRLAADGLTLSAYYIGGVEGCYALAEATAERDGEGPVTVAVSEGQVPDPAIACPDIGIAKVVDIQLDEPLIAVAAFDSSEIPGTY